jgi:hypothetical protein
MKTSSKILISILLTVIFLGGIVFDFNVKTAQAQTVPDCSAEQAAFNANGNYDTVTALRNCQSGATAPTGPGFWSRLKTTLGEEWWNITRSTADIGAGLATAGTSALVLAFLAPIAAILAGVLSIVAALLDASVHISIQGFKLFIDSTDIVSIWVIIRDVLNISFIFILLYIAITTIIGGAGVKTKVQLKDVIIGAILINFSLFFTRILIDGGNILATALYNKLSATSYGTGIWGLTGPIMNSLNLQSLFSFNLVKLTGQTNAVFAVIFSIIIIGVTIWAFLYGAILFLLRNVMLLFLLAISPIGFIGGTLPWFKEKASEWWSALWGQIMVAPFFLFMIYMLIKVGDAMSGLNPLFSNPSLTNFTEGAKAYFNGEGGLNYAMFIQAFLIIGMLLVGTKMTKKLSGQMGDWAEKGIGLAVTGAVSAVTLGGAALAARGASLAARGSALAARGATSQLAGTGGAAAARATRAGLAASQTGKGMQAVGNLLSGKTFDKLAAKPNPLGMALTSGKKDLFSSIKKETGVDLDSSFKYVKDRDKEYEKRHIEFANEIGGKAESDQLELLEKINKNIEDQAETRAKANHREEREKATEIKDDGIRNKEIARIDNLIKADTKRLKVEVAKELGQDYEENRDKIKKLEIEIVAKQPAKNAYILGIKNKKIADKLRSEKGVIKITDEAQEILKKLSKAMKENKIELPGEKEAAAPKEEKKEA